MLYWESRAKCLVSTRSRRHSDGDRWQVGTRRRQPIAAGALKINPAFFSDQIETHIPNLRLTGRRPIHFVDNSMSNGCPQWGARSLYGVGPEDSCFASRGQ